MYLCVCVEYKRVHTANLGSSSAGATNGPVEGAEKNIKEKYQKSNKCSRSHTNTLFYKHTRRGQGDKTTARRLGGGGRGGSQSLLVTLQIRTPNTHIHNMYCWQGDKATARRLGGGGRGGSQSLQSHFSHTITHIHKYGLLKHTTSSWQGDKATARRLSGGGRGGCGRRHRGVGLHQRENDCVYIHTRAIENHLQRMNVAWRLCICDSKREGKKLKLM